MQVSDLFDSPDNIVNGGPNSRTNIEGPERAIVLKGSKRCVDRIVDINEIADDTPISPNL